MRAIVLTCDRYSAFRNHMILRYTKAWPNHPFCFRIPFQSTEDSVLISDVPHEFVNTSLNIKDCVLSLLDGIDDDEWIYWCIDDKYPIKIDTHVFSAVYEWILSISDRSISGISLSRAKSQRGSSRINYRDALYPPGVGLVLSRNSYNNIWIHQFLRVKVIRHLFENFPSHSFKPKEMDTFHRQIPLPAEHRLFVSRTSYAVFGESTSRGSVTSNCAKSMMDLSIDIPKGVDVSEKEKILGDENRNIGYYIKAAEESILILYYRGSHWFEKIRPSMERVGPRPKR